MKCLMHEIVCSDIRMIELKLQRIKLCKKRLLKKKPSRFNNKKLNEWHAELKALEKQEEDTLEELQKAYGDLEFFL